MEVDVTEATRGPGTGTITDKKATRSAGFPSLTLTEALAQVQKLASFGGEHDDASAAGLMGHKSPSGPYRTKMAALRDYGLVGRGDPFKVTPLGVNEQLGKHQTDESAALKPGSWTRSALSP